MFGIGSSKKPASKLIFTVGSGSVSAALVLPGVDENPPVVVWNVRQDFVVQPKVEFSRFSKEMITVLTAVAEAAVKEGMPKLQGGKLGSISLIFASPWHASQTNLLKFEHKESLPVNTHLEEMHTFLADKEREIGSKVSGGTPMLMEKQVIQTLLNGYPTARPQGKRARTMESAVLISMLPSEIYRDVVAILEKVFHQKPAMVHSFMLVSFAVIRDFFAGERHFLLVDVGSEVTDVAVVRGDVLLESASFPEGKHFLLRTVAELLKVDHEEAKSRVVLYRSGKSETAESKKIEAALAEVKARWQSSFEKVLGELQKHTALPNSIFLTAYTHPF